MTRRFRVYHFSQRAKGNYVYDAKDVLALYGISRNTLRNWEKAGLVRLPQPTLACLKPKSRRLYRGHELNRFHDARREASKRPSRGDQLFCLACHAHQAMRGHETVWDSLSGRAGKLHWTCPTCAARATIGASLLTIERLSESGVHIRRADEATNGLPGSGVGCAESGSDHD
jgi:hypothetical protein